MRKIRLLDFVRNGRERLRAVLFYFQNLRSYHQRPPDAQPVPPAYLIYLVAGTPDVSWFLSGGRKAVESIENILQKNGRKLDDLRSILDFGCGCGRVVRHLSYLKASVHGCDSNLKLVEWCKRNLQFAHFTVNTQIPSLPYENESMDFIYALSVFTHIPPDGDSEWIAELFRVLKHGGLLAISTHGEYYLDQLSSLERDLFLKGDPVVRDSGPVGSNRLGVYHPHSYIEHLVKENRIIDMIPCGAYGNPHQDLYLIKKSVSVS